MSKEDLQIALTELVKLQAHYAELLNMHDGGRRHSFKTAEEWIARLREIKTLPTITHEKEEQGHITEGGGPDRDPIHGRCP